MRTATWYDGTDLAGEIWRDVEGFGGRYKVSSKGRVLSMPKYICAKTRLLSPGNAKGYYAYTLCKDEHTRRRIFAHRLVATAFIDNPNGYTEIDHIDGNPKNNDANNLRWCTHQMNSMNPITRARKSIAKTGVRPSESARRKMSLAAKGRKLKPHVIQLLAERNRKPVSMLSIDGAHIRDFDSVKQAAEYLGIDQRRITEVTHKRRAKAGGYKWEII